MRVVLRLARRLSVYELRQQAVGLLVLVLCGALFAAALLLPALYRGVIEDSARASLAGDRYAVVLPEGVRPDGLDQVRTVASLPGTITSSTGSGEVVSYVSDSPGFFSGFGVTLEQGADIDEAEQPGSTAEGAIPLALSREAATTVGADLGDAVSLALDDGQVLEGRLSRVMVLPADPTASVAVADAPAGQAGSRYTSDQELESFLSQEQLDAALISNVANRATDTLELTAPPRLITVASYGVATVASLTVLWVLVTAVLARSTRLRQRDMLLDAGMRPGRALLVLNLAALTTTGVAVVAGLLVGTAAVVLAAPALGDVVGQEWLLPRVLTTVRPDSGLVWLPVLLVGTGAVVVLGALLRLPGRHAPLRSGAVAGVTVVLGAASVVVSLALLLYLRLTQGPVAGWFVSGLLSPVLLAVGVTLLLSRTPWRRGGEASGLERVMSTTRRRLLPLSVTCVLLGTVASGAAAYLVSQSVWGTRTNQPLIEGGYIDFAPVSAAGVAAVDSLDLASRGLAVSTARVPNEGARVRVVTPDVANCYQDLIGTDVFLAECYSSNPDYAETFSEYIGLAADPADAEVRAAPFVMQDGQVTLVVMDADFTILRVEQRSAVPDSGLGGTYTPAVTLPVTDPLVAETGLDPEDGFSLRVSGLQDLPRQEYTAIRGQLLLNASSSMFNEDLGFDDDGSYFTGVLLVGLQSLIAAATLVALLAALTRERRSWWPLTGDLRLPPRRRLELTLPFLAPPVVGILAGTAACAASVTWMVDDSPLWDSRLVFLAPGLLVLALVATRLASLIGSHGGQCRESRRGLRGARTRHGGRSRRRCGPPR